MAMTETAIPLPHYELSSGQAYIDNEATVFAP